MKELSGIVLFSLAFHEGMKWTHVVFSQELSVATLKEFDVSAIPLLSNDKAPLLHYTNILHCCGWRAPLLPCSLTVLACVK